MTPTSARRPSGVRYSKVTVPSTVPSSAAGTSTRRLGQSHAPR